MLFLIRQIRKKEYTMSKLDLPTPQENVVYCIRRILNYPGLSYAYVTVLIEGSRDEIVLFYRYPAISSYWEFMDTVKDIVPLHNAQFRDRLLTFKREENCLCGHTVMSIDLAKDRIK